MHSCSSQEPRHTHEKLVQLDLLKPRTEYIYLCFAAPQLENRNDYEIISVPSYAQPVTYFPPPNVPVSEMVADPYSGSGPLFPKIFGSADSEARNAAFILWKNMCNRP